MTTIILDPNLRGRLPDLSQPFAVSDEAGNIIGRYMPASFGPPLGRGEIDRRKQEKGKAYTTAEVLSLLENS